MPPNATNIAAIACGYYFNLALRTNGGVVAWGDNSAGEATPPNTLSNVVSVAAGSYFSMALQATPGLPLIGKPFAPPATTGTNAILRINAISSTPPTYQWIFYGTNVPGGTNATLLLPNVQPTQAGNYSVIISNQFGAVTNSEISLLVAPVLITVPPQPTSALVSGNTTFIVVASGQPPLQYQWRQGGSDIPGATGTSLNLTNLQLSNSGIYTVAVSNSLGGAISSDAPLTVVPTFTLSTPRDVSSFPGGQASFAISVQANIPLVYQWRFNGVDLPGASQSGYLLTNAAYSHAGVYSVIVSNSYEIQTNSASLVVSPVAGWGDNAYNQLMCPLLSNVVAIVAGDLASCALKSDGKVEVWGVSPTDPRRKVPSDLTNAVAVSAGDGHFLFLRSDGAVGAWGFANSGSTNVPPDASKALAVAAGGYFSLALRTNRTVAAWGQNDAGQTNVPPGLTNVVAIAGGEGHALALKADGTVVSWGFNGPGTTNVPAGLSNVVAIAAGFIESMALRADGSVVVWGSTGYGLPNIPTQTTNIVAISTGYGHCLALRRDGGVVAWGYPYDGETTIPPGLSNATAIAAGESYSLALIPDGTYVPQAQMINPTFDITGFHVAIPTQSGRVYALEFKNSLTADQWSELPLVAGTGDVLVLTDSTASGTQRIYRIRRW